MFDTYFTGTRKDVLVQLQNGEVPDRYVDFLCKRYEITLFDLLTYMSMKGYKSDTLCEQIFLIKIESQDEVDKIIDMINCYCFDATVKDTIFVKLLNSKFDFKITDFIDTTFLPPNKMVPIPQNVGMSEENWNRVFENLMHYGEYITLYRVVTTMSVMKEHQDKIELLRRIRNLLTLTKHSYIEDDILQNEQWINL